VYLLEFAGSHDRFAAREAASAASDVSTIAGGIATARGIDPDRVRRLAFTRRASRLVGRTAPEIESAVALLGAAGIDREGSVAVRARDVRSETGVDARAAERALGRVLVDRGFAVDLEDPDHELRAAFAPPVEAAGEGLCALGWLVAESIRDFGDREPTDRPFFQPGSMDPLLARALANAAGARPGATLLDPMCGTGGVLIEAGLSGADVLGTDAQAKMVRGTRENLEEYLPAERPWSVLQADAARLPVVDDGVDGVVFDAPYGRQSKIAAADLADLVGDALAEARRVASRAVVVGDRSWIEQAREAGWTVTDRFERRVHRSLVRHVLVLTDRERLPDVDALTDADEDSVLER